MKLDIERIKQIAIQNEFQDYKHVQYRDSKNLIHLLKCKSYAVWAILGATYYNIAYSSLLMLLVGLST